MKRTTVLLQRGIWSVPDSKLHLSEAHESDVIFIWRHTKVWRRKWQPTSAFLPGKFHGLRSLASSTQWTWVWASSRSWWRTGKPGVQQSMGLQKVDTTERLNWTELRSLEGYRPRGCIVSDTTDHTHTHTHTHTHSFIHALTQVIISPSQSPPNHEERHLQSYPYPESPLGHIQASPSPAPHWVCNQGRPERLDKNLWLLASHLAPREQSKAVKSPRGVLCLTHTHRVTLRRGQLWGLPSDLPATTKIFMAMAQAALLTIKRKDHIIAVINHWLRFIIAIIPSKFIVTAVNDQFIRALTILGNGLSRLMWVTTNFSRIIA